MKDEHVGAEERCQRREPVVLEGIDSTQKELLRSRKKKHKDITESEKWNDMYLIVFPDSDPLLIPTPCEKAPDFCYHIMKAANTPP